jgi:hypothetical protein
VNPGCEEERRSELSIMKREAKENTGHPTQAGGTRKGLLEKVES